MKIQINTKKSIPVEIGELKFEISMDDKNIQKIKETFNVVDKKLKSVDTNNLEEVKEAYIEVLDLLLGEDSGNKIYKIYDSVLILNEIVVQLSLNLKDEIEALVKTSTQTDVMNEYIKKK